MQPAVESRTVTARGVASAASFGMRSENSAHIFNILRSTLYSNKVLAVLREYSANAWDEHRAAGIPDRPIKVVIPTVLEPTLRIRDYGRGLSEQQVFEVYTQYGSSTKRDSDDVVGCLGIGSKSAFAYADAFTVTSWHGGSKSVYVAVLDETNVGTMSLMHREPCDPSDTGVEISLAVDVADCPQFHREAQGLFPHFTPPPDINVRMDVTPAREQSPHGGIHGGGVWTAVMGCIPYALDLGAVRDALISRGLYSMVSYGGVLRFDIGEVSISASRESLEYTPRTKAAIVAKIDALIDDVRENVARIGSDGSLSDWERRLAVVNVCNALGSYIRSPWGGTSVNLVGDPGTFTLREIKRSRDALPATRTVYVDARTRIIVRDVNRSHRRFDVGPFDLIAAPVDRRDIAAVLAELDECVRRTGIHGVPILRMSEMSCTSASQTGTRGTSTPPKAERRFTLKPEALRNYVRNTPSSNWQSVAHTPSEDDVYVVLDGFRPPDEWGFARMLSDDADAMAWLGMKMPTIVGYRKLSGTIEGTPTGTPYSDWRVAAICRAIEANPDKASVIHQYHFHTIFRSWRRSVTRSAMSQLIGALAPTSPMHDFLSQFEGAADGSVSTAPAVRHVASIVPNKVQSGLRAVYARLPLLDPDNGGPSITILIDEGRSAPWIAYINSTT